MSSAVSSGDLHQEHSAAEQSLIVPVEQSPQHSSATKVSKVF